MKAYVYKAALYCEDCGERIRNLILADEPKFQDMRETEYDSDEFPKGPYPNGGGEADCPQNCDDCKVFLKNPLTSEGYEYVKSLPRGVNDSVDEWISFYEAD